MENNISYIPFIKYKTYLVGPDPEPVEPIGEQVSQLIAVVASIDPSSDVMLDFIKQIIKAVGLNFEKDVYLINTNNQAQTSIFYEQGIARFAKLLVFGENVADLGIHIQVFKYRSVPLNGVKVLIVDDIELIKNNKELKVKLWESLQKMFGLK